MVIQCAMSAVAVVEGFDVIEDLHASLSAGVEATAIDQLQFEGAPEAFHGGIIVAIALAAHRGEQTSVGQCLTIIVGGVLNAAVGMEEQMGRWLPSEQSHLESF